MVDNKYNNDTEEYLDTFLGKVCIFNLSFLKNPISGKLVEIRRDHITIEMRDGRRLCASMAAVAGFCETKRQPGGV